MIEQHLLGREEPAPALIRGLDLLEEGLSKVTVTTTGEMLINPALPFEGIIVLRSGWAYRERQLRDGKRTILTIYLPGDFIGLEMISAGRGLHQVVSLTPSSYQLIAWTKLRTLLSNSDVVLQLYTRRNHELKRLEDLAVLLARGNAEQRIAAFLFSLLARLQRQNLVVQLSFRLPLTQEQIGDHLGLTVVSVNRTLRRLREEGIATVRAHCVAIHDLVALRRLAEMEPQVVAPPLTGQSNGSSPTPVGQTIATISGATASSATAP